MEELEKNLDDSSYKGGTTYEEDFASEKSVPKGEYQALVKKIDEKHKEVIVLQEQNR